MLFIWFPKLSILFNHVKHLWRLVLYYTLPPFTDFLSCNLVIGVIILDINIFGLSIKDWIVCQYYRPLIITLREIIIFLTPNSFSPLYTMICFHWIFYIWVFLLETLIRVCCWLSYRKPSFIKKSHCQRVFFVAKVQVINLASINDKKTVSCFFKHLFISPLWIIKIIFEIDLLLFLSSSSLESKYSSINSRF